MSERCETCRFWKKTLNLIMAEHDCFEYCCRHSPRIFKHNWGEVDEFIITQECHQVGQWPVSHKLSWCGEWETKGRSPELAFFQGKYTWGGTTGLTVRARKVVTRRPGDITCVDDLTPEVLHAIKGCGSCTANEIIAWRDRMLDNGNGQK